MQSAQCVSASLYEIMIKKAWALNASSARSWKTYPYLKLHPFVIPVNSLHLKINTHSANEGVVECVVGVSEQKTGFPNTAIANDEQFEHVVKVLIRSISLPKALVCLCHLLTNALHIESG